MTVGGGVNQRVGLYDGILIKENHILAAGGIRPALEAAFAVAPSNVSVQIEVENLQELAEALDAGARLVLLDNMSLTDMRAAVQWPPAAPSWKPRQCQPGTPSPRLPPPGWT